MPLNFATLPLDLGEETGFAMAIPPAQDALNELNSILQSLQDLKPPGAPRSRIEACAKICTAKENAQSQNSIVDAIFDAFVRSPASHKLGVMYIVDSVIRQWIAGGTDWAAGVKRISAIISSHMSDLIKVAPEDQEAKIAKLVEIWTGCNTFPQATLKKFKKQLSEPRGQSKSLDPAPQVPATFDSSRMPNHNTANGPTATMPMQGVVPTLPIPNGQFQQQQNGQPNVAAPPASSVAPNPLLAALGSAPQQPQFAQLAQLQALAGIMPPAPYVNGHNGHQVSQAAPTLPFAPPATTGAPVSQTPPAPLSTNVTASAANANPLANMLAFSMNQAGSSNTGVQPAQIQMLGQLAQHLTPDALAGVIRALTTGNPQAAVPSPAGLPIPPPPPFGQGLIAPQHQNGSSLGPNLQGSRRNEPDVQSKARHRSRSPDFNRRRRSPPERRSSPTYGTYDPTTANNEPSRASEYDRRGRGKGRGYRHERNDYRRSPPQASRNKPPSPRNMPRHGAPKPVDFDNTLANGFIKVLSRTLFVGGVRTSESDLKAFFARFGAVQSCIVNHDKRHAFLKLCSHQDAIQTKAAVENLPIEEYRGLFERIGWAVGFGPTECADYQTGTSVLPIDILTDADRRWMLTAEYGGTGGQPLSTGMVVEEPDIEIGAGPSSKAISRRGGAGQGGQRGGGNFGNRRGYERHAPYRKPERPEPRQQMQNPGMPEANHIGPPPPVPTFGAPIPGFSFR